MANIRISQLPSPQVALTGTELVPIVQNGQTVQTTLSAIATIVGVSSVSFGTTGLTPAVPTSGAIVVGGVLSVPNGGTGQSSYTNGQLLIGNTTGNTLTKATLTAGSGISITNGTGSITIAIDSAGAVTSFQTSLSGLTPSTATGGAITLAGTLNLSSGGTGLSSYSAGDLPYFASGTAFSKLTIGTANFVLTSSGTAPQYVAQSTLAVGTATNIAGGATGSVPYNTASGTTTFLALGTTNHVLTAGASAPQYVAQSTLSVGSLILSAGSGATNYITYASGTTGSQALYTTTGLTFNATNTTITGGINGGTF